MVSENSPCIAVRCIFLEFSASPYRPLDHRLVVSVVVEVDPAFDFAARYSVGSSFGLVPFKSKITQQVQKVIKTWLEPGDGVLGFSGEGVFGLNWGFIGDCFCWKYG